ncbi:hypothetical protein M3P36_10565 [Altererythrobacter sp. KTW20L]|uniref:hypothetical protein n=1 Tax=Altererythrobacter sp. KTW20L TaxID=2942210 RepID=UPI0020BDCDBA|nr:hypothetical protein [Altererythrobacter sp. KTW20L]MCL6251481.1 hypothetical protein [Altererythrobacter sp. KTW20L]
MTAPFPRQIPQYMRRYYRRLGGFMAAYAAVLIGGLYIAMAGIPLPVRVFLAFLNAAMILGVFWAIFRLLAECDDEYQRLLLVKQTLLATALTLAITTCWQYLVVYEVLTEGPAWVGVIWLAAFGIAAPIVRWRS